MDFLPFVFLPFATKPSKMESPERVDDSRYLVFNLTPSEPKVTALVMRGAWVKTEMLNKNSTVPLCKL